MKQDFSLPPAPKRPLGEVNIWLTSIGLSLGLIMIFGLLGIIVVNGLEAFWPKTIHELTIAPSSKEEQPLVLYAGITKDQTRHVPADPARPGSTARDVREYQLFTGSKEIYGQSYRYVDAHNITASATPKGLLCLERMEGGKAMVRPLELKLSSGQTIPAASPEFMAAFRRALDRETELRDRIKAIDTRDIGSVNTRLADAKLDIKAIERSYDIREENGRRTAVPRKNPILTDMDDPAGELDRLRAKVEQLNAEYARYTAEAARLREQQGRDSLVYALGDGEKKEIRMDKIVYGYQPNDLGFSGKCGVFLHSLYHFVMDDPREANTEGGIFPAIFGTFIMTLLMSVLVTPVGVIGAIYLREYARQGHLVQAVRICVNNLAGVPSIVFGVFGLGFFVYYLGGTIDELFYWKKLAVDNTPTFGTSGILWASLTLALMTLPVVIVSTEEALSAVPRGLREAALACGASKWQMIKRIILPSALPGVMTGLILAMARGAGEVAPLMVTGVVKLAPSLPIDGEGPFIHLERKFMHLGFHIYDVGFQSPDSDAAQPMVFATTLLLILLVVVMNLTAILIRNRLRKKYAASSF